jgi:creatinine amidohydrolase
VPDTVGGRRDRALLLTFVLTGRRRCEVIGLTAGGIVYPPLYYGTGGGHGGYPWTITMETGAEMRALLDRSLTRLEAFGVRLAVLFTGHFPDEQIEVVEAAARDCNARGGPLSAMALSLNRVQGAAIGPDHAGIFETTLLHALLPDRVAIDRLPPRASDQAPDDPWGAARQEPGHPLWGVVGPDPRDFDPAAGPALLGACVDWVVREVGARLRAIVPTDREA